MRATFKVDVRGLETMIREKRDRTGRALHGIVNQATLNVAGRAFDLLKPSDVAGKRADIRRYLSEPVSTRVRIAKSGRHKGHFIRAGSKASQLQRVNLIVQARRRRAGLKGLYGDAMRAAAGAFKRRAQVSVGFVKSLYLPVIRGLNPVCKYKFPFAKTRHISRWPGSAGYGVVSPAPARQSLNPTASFRIGAGLSRKGENAKVQAMHEEALGKAIRAEEVEMKRHALEELKRAA